MPVNSSVIQQDINTRPLGSDHQPSGIILLKTSDCASAENILYRREHRAFQVDPGDSSHIRPRPDHPLCALEHRQYGDSLKNGLPIEIKTVVFGGINHISVNEAVIVPDVSR